MRVPHLLLMTATMGCTAEGDNTLEPCPSGIREAFAASVATPTGGVQTDMTQCVTAGWSFLPCEDGQPEHCNYFFGPNQPASAPPSLIFGEFVFQTAVGHIESSGPSVLDGSTRPIVDLAFNQQGEMFLLTETADLLQLNSTTKRLDTILVGEEWAPGNLAVHMAYDDPDGGFIFISTLDESQEYVVHLVSARVSTAGAAFAAVTREPNTYYEGGALTVHALDEHPGGKFYEIRPDGGLWGHQRKHFLVKPVLDVDGAQVFAPLGDPQSLTISHW